MPYGAVSVRSFVLASLFGSSKRSGAPSSLYFALLRHATDPDTILGTEPTIGVNSYARVSAVNNDALWTITDEEMVNDVTITWPVSTGSWNASPLNQWAAFDASTAGVCWAFGELTDDLDISVAGRVPSAAPGALVLTQAA